MLVLAMKSPPSCGFAQLLWCLSPAPSCICQCEAGSLGAATTGQSRDLWCQAATALVPCAVQGCKSWLAARLRSVRAERRGFIKYPRELLYHERLLLCQSTRSRWCVQMKTSTWRVFQQVGV
eukprot:1707134-Amphidinium_carterae.1